MNYFSDLLDCVFEHFFGVGKLWGDVYFDVPLGFNEKMSFMNKIEPVDC